VTLVIPARFNGPPGSANGGYTCGVVAALVGEPAQVTLRLPPPLERPLRVEHEAGGVSVYDGDALVAEAVHADVDVAPPARVALEDAERAAAGYKGFREHAFPTCFVCGPDRDDGLGIYAGRVEGTDLVASPWAPRESRRELVWAALDCPGAFAVGFAGRGELVLGRLAARIERVPEVGEQCIVVGWPLGEEGRKRYAGTALFTAGGELLARARATWIEPRS